MNNSAVDLKTLTFPSLDEQSYSTRLADLQRELMLYQQLIYLRGKKVVIAIEGTDAAGKGGLIKRMIEPMDPRGYQVHSIGAPFGKEQQEHYLQRFWRRIPRSGNIAIFDRTWYGRVLIEKIELNLPEQQCSATYQDINHFEQQLINENYLLIKLFLHITKDEQKKRLTSRLNSNDKHWKLTPADFTSRSYWDDYQREYQRMLHLSLKADIPWHVIAANDKYHARIQALEIIIGYFSEQLGEAKLPPLDQKLKHIAEKYL